jgi:hypothetical protein
MGGEAAQLSSNSIQVHSWSFEIQPVVVVHSAFMVRQVSFPILSKGK